jgi:glutamate-1-semialdehyde 2,1-aminomutase
MLNSPFDLHRTARKYLPGGVSASARANAAIGHPFYVTRGSGSKIYDLEGREYIDMCMSHGAAFLGHNNPKIKAAVSKALDVGIICSYETEYQIKLAKKLTDLVPCAEMVRFAGSGTETIMHALRLCRSATGREKIIKFEGHFHGYSDDIYFSSAPPLERAGDPLEPTPFPQSSGIPNENANRLVIVPFNDQAALQSAFVHHGDQVAALILEPVNYDAGCIEPQPGFLELCRQLCDRYGVLLFFDEVLTAFRFSVGCAQQYFGVVPDIAVLGKAFGAGMPISAIVGKRNVMRHLRPEGESEHSGTYLAHLTAVMAALAALEEYSQPGFYQHLEQLGKFFYPGFQDIIDRSGVPARLQYVGPRFGLYFGLTEEVKDYRQSALQNRQMFLKFIAGCIERGVYFHVSPHHGFSAAHSEADLLLALDVIETVLKSLRR